MSSESLEAVVKEKLGLTHIKNIGLGGGGYISSGSTYDTDKYGRVFIKVNSNCWARAMFDGEYASLEALGQPNIVKMPKPIKVIDHPEGGAMLVMEYVDMTNRLHKHSSLLGEQIARLHLHNASLQEKTLEAESRVHKDDTIPEYVSMFGFHTNTYCGKFEMDNTWCANWETFYANRIEEQIKILQKNDGDRLARELWNKLLVRFSMFFEGVDIKPAIVHGDLWRGNTCETDEGPVIFDPASFYGHSEYDMGLTYLFDGFNTHFYKAYHKVIPKAPGFEMRKDLYKLFNYINHWNHFGCEYRNASLSSLQSCINHVYN